MRVAEWSGWCCDDSFPFRIFSMAFSPSVAVAWPRGVSE